jgi:hypothetical protein
LLRLEAAEVALEAADDEEGGGDDDVMLDFYNKLMAELAGRVEDSTGDVRRLNIALREFFECVELSQVEDGIEMLPVLSAQAFERLLREASESGSLTGWPVGHVDAEPAPLRSMHNPSKVW